MTDTIREAVEARAKEMCRADCAGPWCREEGRCVGMRFDVAKNRHVASWRAFLPDARAAGEAEGE